MLQHHLGFVEASQHYSLLTVGDGLAAQIPALLISVATGIIVTRAASDRDLGCDIANQILAQRKAPLVAAGAIGGFALIPGLPKLPVPDHRGDLRCDRLGRAQRDARASRTKPCGRRRAAAARPRRRADGRGRVDALELAIGFGLVPLVDGGGSGELAAAPREHDPPPDRG